MVHGSDSPESRAREIDLFFPAPELWSGVSCPSALWLLASRSPQRRAILERLGSPSGAPGGRRGARGGGPGQVALENALGKARAVWRRRPPASWCSAWTRSWLWRAGSTASRRMSATRGRRCALWRRHSHRVQRRRADRGWAGAHGAGAHRGQLSDARRGVDRLVPGYGGVARSRRRLCDPGRGGGAGARDAGRLRECRRPAAGDACSICARSC